MKIKATDFLVKEGEKVSLKKWPTLIHPFYKSKEQCHDYLKEHIEQLNALQEVHYASRSYPMLLIFQGMDASGKDSVIRHVMSGINPQGCQVASFKHPVGVELAHDYLWRYIQYLPERGKIAIFNRSYYEEVLIVRVHPEILQGQGVPNERVNSQKIWRERFQTIKHLEKHLDFNGTRVLKFFLHLSHKEQKKRFLDRIDDPSKHWKITQADMQERAYWDDYMAVYEECLSETSTSYSPWYIVPADDKANTWLIVAHIILQALKELKMSYPPLSNERLEELQTFRTVLEG